MWPTWNSESIYFTMRFSPHVQLFYFNDRLEFCEFLEWKIKRINNADLFSQPPLLIFTKGANISGGHCNYNNVYNNNNNIYYYYSIWLGSWNTSENVMWTEALSQSSNKKIFNLFIYLFTLLLTQILFSVVLIVVFICMFIHFIIFVYFIYLILYLYCLCSVKQLEKLLLNVLDKTKFIIIIIIVIIITIKVLGRLWVNILCLRASADKKVWEPLSYSMCTVF